MKFIIGHTVIRLRAVSPITVAKLKDVVELNGHLITGQYGGETSHWPSYGLCHRCGQSVLGGADAYFASIPCGGEQL